VHTLPGAPRRDAGNAAAGARTDALSAGNASGIQPAASRLPATVSPGSPPNTPRPFSPRRHGKKAGDELYTPALIVAKKEQPTQPCPSCRSEMVIRPATAGTNKGRLFLVCSAYPACRTCLPVPEPAEGSRIYGSNAGSTCLNGIAWFSREYCPVVRSGRNQGRPRPPVPLRKRPDRQAVRRKTDGAEG